LIFRNSLEKWVAEDNRSRIFWNVIHDQQGYLVGTAKIFSSRRQTITHYSAISDKTEVHIDYEAVLLADLPNGLKEGDKIQLKGKSVFEIQEGKISH
jgi:hypothetical protein